MNRLAACLALILTSTLPLPAADPAPARPPLREPDQVLHPWQAGDWKGQLPGDWKLEGPEQTEVTAHMGGTLTIKNISGPVLAYFAPDKKTEKPGKGIVICPGGGYNILAWDLEGTEVATFLSARGYHAWVLKYRLPRKGTDPVRHLPALQDAQRSLSLVRSLAPGLGLDPAQLGIMGFSAGGHLAGLTATTGNERAYPARDSIDNIPCRPDFCALIYPAYLLADDKNPGVKPGPANPPAFLCHSADDALTWRHSSSFFEGLQSHKIRSELHVWPDGGHGYGMRSPHTPRAWPPLLAAWLGQLQEG